jgi:hypothetical protein
VDSVLSAWWSVEDTGLAAAGSLEYPKLVLKA